MLQKTISILLMIVNGIAIAGTAGPICTSNPVTIPCQVSQWELGVQALYLKPAYSYTLGYASTTTGIGTQKIEPDWGWGYRLLGAYHFNTGNDITLNWSHYDVDSQLGLYSGQYLQLPVGVISANYQLFLNNKYDEINLVMGQQVNLSQVKSARFYTGLKFADLRVDGTNTYAVAPAFIAVTGGSARDLTSTDFNGVGPVMGVDYAFNLSPRLSITANTAGSLLYGTSRYNFSTGYANGLVVSTIYGSKRIVVPGVEAKLGANYAYELAQGMLNVEGGYQAINYFSALQGRPLTTSSVLNSDFGLFGPYLGVKWIGNA
ncbi:MAG: Lpg1974 family pore-forming outer membrane protein [Legionella sp.]|nr:Lpg1974 family pore-forming outer membrane protein [Legionella sp.]